MGLLHHPLILVLALFGTFFGITFQLLYYYVLLRITDEGSVPEMRIWSILKIKSDLKWCIHLSRSLFSYFSLTFNSMESYYPEDLLVYYKFLKNSNLWRTYSTSGKGLLQDPPPPPFHCKKKSR